MGADQRGRGLSDAQGRAPIARLTSVYLPRAPPRTGHSIEQLRDDTSEHHHTLGIDAERLSGLDFSHPGEFHDRPTRRVKDQLLDILGVALHAEALATQEGDLRYRGHYVESKDAEGATSLSRSMAHASDNRPRGRRATTWTFTARYSAPPPTAVRLRSGVKPKARTGAVAGAMPAPVAKRVRQDDERDRQAGYPRLADLALDAAAPRVRPRESASWSRGRSDLSCPRVHEHPQQLADCRFSTAGSWQGQVILDAVVVAAAVLVLPT